MKNIFELTVSNLYNLSVMKVGALDTGGSECNSNS